MSETFLLISQKLNFEIEILYLCLYLLSFLTLLQILCRLTIEAFYLYFMINKNKKV